MARRMARVTVAPGCWTKMVDWAKLKGCQVVGRVPLAGGASIADVIAPTDSPFFQLFNDEDAAVWVMNISESTEVLCQAPLNPHRAVTG